MTVVADFSTPTKMRSQQLPENDVTSHRPSNYMLRKLNAVRYFQANRGAQAQSDTCEPPTTAGANTPSNNNVKRSKLDFINEINGDSGMVLVKEAKHASEVPPLRSLPLVTMKSISEKSARCGKKAAKDNDNEVRSEDESWKDGSKKLAAILSEAKGYLEAFDDKFSELSSNFSKLTSTSGNNMNENLDENQTNSEDYEDEVCILSPEEWTKSQLWFDRKCGGAKRLKSGQQREDDIDCEPGSINSVESVSSGSNTDLRHSSHNPDLVSMSIVKHEEPGGVKVMQSLRLFEKLYNKLTKDYRIIPGGERKSIYNHLEAANHLKRNGQCVELDKPFGHVPGVEIGDEFRFRSQLAIISLHRPLIAAVDHVTLDGEKYATSVVDLGRDENSSKVQDVLIFSSLGGNTKIERENLALMNSMSAGYPIRVIHKRKGRTGPGFTYTYGGLYTINEARSEKDDQTGRLVLKFELCRIPGQPAIPLDLETAIPSEKVETVRIWDDVSNGKEKMPIRAVNAVDDLKPPAFVYVASMVYPKWYERMKPDGCRCVNGCSDSHRCRCIKKNGGEIPYNEDMAIMRRKPWVYECGPSCKCPPTCMNRVGQRGLQYRLELFKTDCRGWGVRSPDLIPSGGFVCEYLGELLRDKDADLRVGHDEYLFDIYNSRGGRADGFAIDGVAHGNVGRFINHSCSPNVYAQNVCYDHVDKRMPHIMFFATKDIPPLEELAYDYNYKLDTVRDANGNIKTKACYCGSRKCRGRLY